MTEAQLKKFYLEDHIEGATIQCGTYEMTAAEIIEFATKWDPQPWHIDEELAKASFFGGLTACSAHIFAVFSIISPQWQNGAVQTAIASLGFDEMRMLKPVYAGDRLSCSSFIDTVRPSRSKPDRGVVIYETSLRNQHDEPVFSIKCSTLMARRPGATAP